MSITYELRVFDTIGSFFVDVFYSHIYNAAVSSRGEDSQSQSHSRELIVEYKKLSTSYVSGVKSEKRCYDNVLGGAHKFFNAVFGVDKLSLPEFMTTILECMLPPSIASHADSKFRETIVGYTINELVSRLCVHCNSAEVIEKILFDRNGEGAKRTIESLQDQSVKILCDCKDRVHAEFVEESEGIANYRSKYLQLKDSYDSLESKYNAEKKRGKALRDELEEAETREIKYKELIRLLQSQQVAPVQMVPVQQVYQQPPPRPHWGAWRGAHQSYPHAPHAPHQDHQPASGSPNNSNNIQSAPPAAVPIDQSSAPAFGSAMTKIKAKKIVGADFFE